MQEFIKEKKVYIIVMVSIFLIIGGIWFYFNKKNDKILLSNQNSDGSINAEEFLIENTGEQEASEGDLEIEEQTIETEIMVHIVGQVQNPGVVMVKDGTRLIEAIEKLGGPTSQADLEAINLAMKVKDEEKVYIPKEGEIEKEDIMMEVNNQGLGQNQDSDIININTATQEQLKTLPGIGDSISTSIIEYRESNGGFKSIEDIQNVNRIGNKIFQDIKERISV